MTLTKFEQESTNALAQAMYKSMIGELTEYDLTLRKTGYSHEHVFMLISALVRDAERRMPEPETGAVKHEAVRQMFDRLCAEFSIIARLDPSTTRIYFSYENKMLLVLTDFLIGQTAAVYNTNHFAGVNSDGDGGRDNRSRGNNPNR